MPANTVYVGRPSVDANEFDWRDCLEAYEDLPAPEAMRAARAIAVEFHKLKLKAAMERDPQATALMIKRLRGKNLACWCPLDQPCHADTLLEIANA
jgi:hypothetical protein